MATITNADELIAALRAASAGDVIELAGGNYGDVVLNGFSFSSGVTLRSQNAASPATFGSLRISNSSNLTFDRIAVQHTLANAEPDWVSALRIDASDHIAITNSDISGTADGDFTNDCQGLLVLDSHDVVISGNTFHDLKIGTSAGRSEFVDIRNNSYTDIRTDGVDVANVRSVSVEGNTFTNFHPSSALGDHPDMIQVWNDGSFGDMSGIAIRNNILRKGTGADVQSIFIQGAVADASGIIPQQAHDIIVDGNQISGGASQGIWLSSVSTAAITGNTLTLAPGGASQPTIRTDHTTNVTVQGNTAPQINDVGSTGLSYSSNTLTSGSASGGSITGTSGDDTLMGSAGNDTIKGLSGDDTAYGAGGNDVIDGADGNDKLNGGDGNDTLNGGAGSDDLRGGNGNDGFFGGGGNDRLFGDSGIDTLYGDGGNDALEGGLGNDVLIGGAGADRFVFADGSGSDKINDFQDGSDLIDMSQLSAVSSMADLQIVVVSATETLIRYFDGVAAAELRIIGAGTITIGQSDFAF